MRVVMGAIFGLGIGLAAMARATVACGSYDQTLLRLDSIKKNGVDQALPSQRTTQLDSAIYAAPTTGTVLYPRGSQLFDPTTGAFVAVEVTE